MGGTEAQVKLTLRAWRRGAPGDGGGGNGNKALRAELQMTCPDSRAEITAVGTGRGEQEGRRALLSEEHAGVHTGAGIRLKGLTPTPAGCKLRWVSAFRSERRTPPSPWETQGSASKAPS